MKCKWEKILTGEELTELFQKTSFPHYPLEIEHIKGENSDSVFDCYPDYNIYYKGASKPFASCQRWNDAIFIKAIMDYFINKT